MKIQSFHNRFHMGVGCLAALIIMIVPSLAQSPSAANIEGRVLNTDTGEYVELARITIDGTAVEAFSDAIGFYRLSNVPVGALTARAYRTGLPPQEHRVQTTAGRTVQQDFNVTARHVKLEAITVLDRFVVASSKEMDQAALAIKTQRFAPNLVNVVAADEFGGAAESEIGEVLKSLPGIAMDLGGGGEPYRVSLDGVPSDNVPVTAGGFNLPSGDSGTSRAISLHQVAINSISRLEVINTPTPENSGAALAGSVNLVPRSAFERVNPFYDLRATLSCATTNAA